MRESRRHYVTGSAFTLQGQQASKQARSRWKEKVDGKKNGLENIEKKGKSASRGQRRSKEGGSKTGEKAESSAKEQQVGMGAERDGRWSRPCQGKTGSRFGR